MSFPFIHNRCGSQSPSPSGTDAKDSLHLLAAPFFTAAYAIIKMYTHYLIYVSPKHSKPLFFPFIAQPKSKTTNKEKKVPIHTPIHQILPVITFNLSETLSSFCFLWITNFPTYPPTPYQFSWQPSHHLLLSCSVYRR